jgi:hypothetical protein
MTPTHGDLDQLARSAEEEMRAIDQWLTRNPDPGEVIGALREARAAERALRAACAHLAGYYVYERELDEEDEPEELLNPEEALLD